MELTRRTRRSGPGRSVWLPRPAKSPISAYPMACQLVWERSLPRDLASPDVEYDAEGPARRARCIRNARSVQFNIRNMSPFVLETILVHSCSFQTVGPGDVATVKQGRGQSVRWPADCPPGLGLRRRSRLSLAAFRIMRGTMNGCSSGHPASRSKGDLFGRWAGFEASTDPKSVSLSCHCRRALVRMWHE
jgi:hypothetical protein